MIHHTIEHKTRNSLIFDPRLYDSLNFGTLCQLKRLLTKLLHYKDKIIGEISMESQLFHMLNDKSLTFGVNLHPQVPPRISVLC